MSTNSYKHRSKPSKRSIRLSALASMIGYHKHAGEWYDAEESTKVMIDEFPMWQQVSPKSRKVGMTQVRKFIETLEPLNK